MTAKDTFITVNRFGLGPRPGEMEVIGRDQKGWLEQQIESVRPVRNFNRLKGSKELASSLLGLKQASNKEKKAFLAKAKKNYMREMEARFDNDVVTQQPFFERLVLFWSNHFTVSGKAKPFLNLVVGPYEREAIRPHILGKFSDLLLAVTQHPVMLVYLDNASSFGPNSLAGKRRGRGLNENLAREILELHTLGVNGGYTQDDVIALAKIITGWTVDRNKGNFSFVRFVHEPGSHELLGKNYGQGGIEQGMAALNDLANHPSTAKFIATKLARHFVADDPPQSAVRKLEKTFLQSGGDLKQVYRTLISMPEVWKDPVPKVKTPYEMIVSSLRLLGAKDDIPFDKVIPSLALMDHIPFMALSPAGWPDTEEDWISPNAVINRVEWCHALSQIIPYDGNPLELAKQVIGPVAKPETLQWISRAPSSKDGLALLLASAEFQRR